ncbi:hypothetical protein MKW98_032487 [Papaver atlanticum]|uniref:Uncharacterized protein n=1 Tax=Papaver atlanticum TaxID=357466 RepID=A0AAD4SVJ7_9MAGN|nr:hypothetical protein MKW98_032487 [Papaver atlanticum]
MTHQTILRQHTVGLSLYSSFPNPNEVVLLESKEQERLLRISLQICGIVVESLPTARCVPTLLNAISSRCISLQDEIVAGFHVSVSERFVPA